MVELSVEEWIKSTIEKKGYIRSIEDLDDFVEKTGSGLTKFPMWMKKHGLRFDKKNNCWFIDDGIVRGVVDPFFRPPSNPSNHIELLNYRWIWDQIQQTPTQTAAARETGLSTSKLHKINSMLEEYYVEGFLDDWLRVTEKLLEIQIQRGSDHKSDRLMLELRQVFVEYVRDPENHDPPTNDDIEWIYQELLKDFSSLQNVNHSNSGSLEKMTEIERIINESGKQNFPRNQGAWGSFEKACGDITNCGWKMGMCKSSSGKDNAINRMYTTGVIRAYPQVLIQCLFIDDFLEEISEVYKTEFGEKMRCSPIMILVSEDEDHNWRPTRVLVQDKHPLLPLSRDRIEEMFPVAEIIRAETTLFEITEGWSVEQGDELFFQLSMLSGVYARAKKSDTGFVVLSGSRASMEENDSWISGRMKRDKLLSQGVLVEQPDGMYQFMEDVEFSSPSTAASVVRALQTNGRTAWKEVRTGKKYVEFFGRVNPPKIEAKMNSDIIQITSLKETLERILELQNDFNSANTPEMKERGILIRKIGPEILRSWIKSHPKLSAEGRDGTGRKTLVPWFRVHSPENSPSATTGWYFAFLFSADGNSVYLSLMQGTTNFINNQFIRKSPDILYERAVWAIESLPKLPLMVSPELKYGRADAKGEVIYLGNGELAKAYRRGDIMHYRYDKHNIPSDDKLRKHVGVMIHLLNTLYKKEVNNEFL